MKGSRWFIVFIVAFLFIMFAIECHLPKNFVWKPTFGHHDEQPFGCAVFDSVLSSSLPQGYTFSRKSLYQLEQEDTTQRRGILVISDNLRLSDVDVNALLKMAERGDKIMLVSTLFLWRNAEIRSCSADIWKIPCSSGLTILTSVRWL